VYIRRTLLAAFFDVKLEIVVICDEIEVILWVKSVVELFQPDLRAARR
jgi:hypothetical protein